MTGNGLVANQQLIISGVGGQGILFITRLLAEAAIHRGLAVLSSETHGMAQRGGVVVSHLKVGDYGSPLVRAGRADGMLVMKADNFPLHLPFLRPGGWAAINAPSRDSGEGWPLSRAVDADRLAAEAGFPQTVNLILLGFILSPHNPFPFFCAADDVRGVLLRKMAGKGALADRSLRAFETGLGQGAAGHGEVGPC